MPTPPNRGFEVDLEAGAGENWLLSIGIDAYRHCRTLNNAVQDTEAFEAVLVEKYGFHPDRVIRRLEGDATREGIWTAFEEMERKVAGTTT